MDNNKQTIIMKRLEKTANALRKNNMEAYVVNTNAEAVEVAKSLISEGETIASGGTMSMVECGVLELVKNGKYNYLDRSTCETAEQIDEVYHKAFSADTYFTSANAVTENGELYNVDGNSNRVAAIAFGPKSVVVIAGYNKIVANLDDAALRVKKIAAPANGVRLGIKTPCSVTGECVSCNNGGDAASGCYSECRICCNYLISGYQRHKNRIKVILVANELGY